MFDRPRVGQNGVDCPMSRAVRPKASKVPPGRNGWIRPLWKAFHKGRYAKFSIMESSGVGLVPTPGGLRRTGNAAFS